MDKRRLWSTGPREQWQIDNAAKCGCRGTDEMCACQNDPEVFTRKSELSRLQAENERLKGELEDFKEIANAQGQDRCKQMLRAEAAEAQLTALRASLEPVVEAVERAEKERGPFWICMSIKDMKTIGDWLLGPARDFIRGERETQTKDNDQC